MQRSPITTHILDANLGMPASSVAVTLSIESDGDWKIIAEDKTDKDGRINHWLGEQTRMCGEYRVHFDVKTYFHMLGTPCLYPRVTIDFTVTDADQHYHIPLLITANSYSTYRGS